MTTAGNIRNTRLWKKKNKYSWKEQMLPQEVDVHFADETCTRSTRYEE